MSRLIFFLGLAFSFLSFQCMAQLPEKLKEGFLPAFFEGTWRDSSENIYEQWKRVRSDSLSGKGYSLENNKEKISEYLSLWVCERGVVYRATVPNQNDGKPIDFLLTTWNDSICTFTNPVHDFPTFISYHRTNDIMRIDIHDNQGQGFELTMNKIHK
jgi:hypothetical protein